MLCGDVDFILQSVSDYLIGNFRKNHRIPQNYQIASRSGCTAHSAVATHTRQFLACAPSLGGAKCFPKIHGLRLLGMTNFSEFQPVDTLRLIAAGYVDFVEFVAGIMAMTR